MGKAGTFLISPLSFPIENVPKKKNKNLRGQPNLWSRFIPTYVHDRHADPSSSSSSSSFSSSFQTSHLRSILASEGIPMPLVAVW